MLCTSRFPLLTAGDCPFPELCRRSDTIPAMDIRCKDCAVGHEAKIGSISDDTVFYLMSRGISEEDARALIVSGFADNVSKELPLEYAVEMNNLIRLEMKGSIG